MSQSKWNSRKFYTMVGSVGLFTILLIYDHITPEVYQTLMMISVGTYFCANVAEKYVGNNR